MLLCEKNFNAKMKFSFMICALFANYFSACHCDPTNETIESLDNKEVCTNSSKGMSTTTTKLTRLS